MKQIKIFGLGGQGVVTGARVFAHAVAIGENKHALSVPAYGHERRGAPVYSDLMISDEPILLRTFVYEPDVVVIFDLSVMEKGVDVMVGTSKDTIFVVNNPKVPDDCPFPDALGQCPFNQHTILYVDARAISLKVLKLDIPNTTMLGAMAGAGLCSLKAVKEAIFASFGEKAGAINSKCAERGYNELTS